MNELRQLGKTVEKFIVQVEDENGNKKENDIVRAFKSRLKVKASHEKNPEKRKEYRQHNPEKIKEGNKKYYKNNKDKILEKRKEYRQHNPEKKKEYNKKYYADNKDEILKKHKEKATLKKQEKEVREFLNELRNQRNEKPNLLQKNNTISK